MSGYPNMSGYSILLNHPHAMMGGPCKMVGGGELMGAQPGLHQMQGMPHLHPWQLHRLRQFWQAAPMRSSQVVVKASAAGAKGPATRAAPPKLLTGAQTGGQSELSAKRSRQSFTDAATSPMARSGRPSPFQQDAASSPIHWEKIGSPSLLDASGRQTRGEGESPGQLSSAETPDKSGDFATLFRARASPATTYEMQHGTMSPADGAAQRPHSVGTDYGQRETTNLSLENLRAHVVSSKDPGSAPEPGFFTPANNRGPAQSQACTRTSGGFGKVMCGMGITWGRDKQGRMMIFRIHQGGGADLCGGLHIGDVLVEIDGEDVASMDPAAMAPLLVGVEGSRALLGVKRFPSDTLLRYYVVRCQPRAARGALHHITNGRT